jgi:hypothetical protein
VKAHLGFESASGAGVRGEGGAKGIRDGADGGQVMRHPFPADPQHDHLRVGGLDRHRGGTRLLRRQVNRSYTLVRSAADSSVSYDAFDPGFTCGCPRSCTAAAWTSTPGCTARSRRPPWYTP